MRLSRRHFLHGVGCAVPLLGMPFLSRQDEEDRFNVISYNIYGCTGFPRNQPRAQAAVSRGQMARRIAMELALYDPDLINFSESPREALTQEIADELGMHHVRFPSGGNWPGTILSRFKIEESENVPLGRERPEDLYTRHWGRAVLRLENGEPLIVHSAHLYPNAIADRRLREIPPMIESMRPDLEAGHSMLLIGDLNHPPESEEYRLWIDAGWIDTFAELGEGDGFTFGADNLRFRIDYVFAAGSIAEALVEARPLNEGAFRLNPDDDGSFALSDHLPQLASFQL